MKGRIIIAALITAFVGAALLLTFEGAISLFMGWIIYPGQVATKISADWPSVLVGGSALAFFAAGVHWLGWSMMRRQDASTNPTWKLRWTGTVVAGVLVLFVAGTSAIGIVHQSVWLFTRERPLFRQCLAHHSSSSTNARMIANELETYAAVFGRLPIGGTFAPDGSMLHSWETELLPYMSISSGMDMKLAWNDPKNRRFAKCVIPNFINSELRGADLEDAEGYGLSHYAANMRVMAANKGLKIAEIKDTANTFVVGEVNAEFKPWSHPGNWRDPGQGINRSPQGFGGASNSSGAHLLMADGSVRFVSGTTDPTVLKALGDPQCEDLAMKSAGARVH
jgi:Protein of unknown function (DUF1559)